MAQLKDFLSFEIDISKTVQEADAMIAKYKQLKGDVAGVRSEIEKLKDRQRELQTQALKADDTKAAKAYRKEAQLVGQEIKIATDNARKLDKEITQLNKDFAGAKPAVGTYAELTAKLKQLQFERQNLAPIGSQRFDELTTETNAIIQQLKELDAQVGQFQRNVGNYRNEIVNAFGDLGFADLATQQIAVVREEAEKARTEAIRLGNEYREALNQNSGKTEAELKAIKEAAEQAALAAGKATAQLEQLDSTSLTAIKKELEEAFSLQGIIRQGVGIAVGQLAVDSVLGGISDVVTFQREISAAQGEVAKLNDAFSKTDISNITNQLREIDTTTPLKDLLKIAAIGGQFDVAANGTKKFVEAVDAVNIALGDDFNNNADEVANTVGKLANTYGDATKSIDENITKTGSLLNEISKLPVTTGKFIADFALATSAAANTYKTSIGDFAGIGSVLEQAGFESKTAGNNVSKLFGQLTANVAKYSKVLQLSGQEQKQFATLLNTDTNEALLFFLEKLDLLNKSPIEIDATLKKLGLNDTEIIGITKTLGVNIDKVRASQEFANKAFSDGTSITNERAKALASLDSVLSRISNTLANVFASPEVINGLTSIANAILTVINFAIGLIGVLAQLPKFIKENKVSISLLTIGLAAFNASIIIASAQTLAYTVVMTGWNLATKAAAIATNIFNGAMRLLNITMRANPIGFVIGLVATLSGVIVGLYQNSDSFRATLDGLWATAKTVFSGLSNLAYEFAKTYFSVFDLVGGLLEGVFTLNPSKIQSAVTAFSEQGGKFISAAKKIGTESGDAYKAAYDKSIKQSKVDKATAQKAEKKANSNTSDNINNPPLPPAPPDTKAQERIAEAANKRKQIELDTQKGLQQARADYQKSLLDSEQNFNDKFLVLANARAEEVEKNKEAYDKDKTNLDEQLREKVLNKSQYNNLVAQLDETRRLGDLAAENEYNKKLKQANKERNEAILSSRKQLDDSLIALQKTSSEGATQSDQRAISADIVQQQLQADVTQQQAKIKDLELQVSLVPNDEALVNALAAAKVELQNIVAQAANETSGIIAEGFTADVEDGIAIIEERFLQSQNSIKDKAAADREALAAQPTDTEAQRQAVDTAKQTIDTNEQSALLANERAGLEARKALYTQYYSSLANETELSAADREAIEKNLAEKIKGINNDIAASDRDLSAQRVSIAEQTAEQRAKIEADEKEVRDAILSSVQQLESAAFELAKSNTEAELQQTLSSLDEKKQKELDTFGTTQEKRAEIEARYAAKAKAATKAANEEKKNQAITQAIINGVLAVTDILAKNAGNPILAGVLIATTAALTAFNIAQIRRQQFRYGGTVGGERHEQGGTPIEAERGEGIVTRQGMSQYAEVVSTANQAGGGVRMPGTRGITDERKSLLATFNNLLRSNTPTIPNLTPTFVFLRAMDNGRNTQTDLTNTNELLSDIYREQRTMRSELTDLKVEFKSRIKKRNYVA